MTLYAGLDVSDKSTHVCVVDTDGAIRWRGVCATDPETVAATLVRHAAGVERVVLETGALSAFLYNGLNERAVPVVCICARHAKGVLSARVNKSDVHDAEGLAQLARTGWYKAVHIKGSATHLDRAELKVREQLIKAHHAMLGQLRGLLKLFGLRLGKVTTPGKRAERLAALFTQKPELKPVLAPLVAGLCAIETQIAASIRGLKRRAAADPVVARMMSVLASARSPRLPSRAVSRIRAASPARRMRAPMRAWSPGASSQASGIPRATSPRPAIRCSDPRFTRPPTICSPASSGPVRCRRGARHSSPPRAPSVLASPSHASSPSSYTGYGTPASTSNGRNESVHGRLTGCHRTTSLVL